MEMTGRTQADLASLLRSRSRASEILSRRRLLTLSMIHKISRERHLPAEVLVQPYKRALKTRRAKAA
jgi:HTH-type transcriptional regulator/antitoxin HigA